MTLIRAIAFLLHFTLVPVALGRLITRKDNSERGSRIASTYMVGLFASMGIFFVLFAILEWHQNWNTFSEPFTGCFTALCIAYSVLIGILVLIWIVKDFGAIKAFPGFIKGRIDFICERIRNDRFIALYIFGALAILLVQMYFAYGYQVNEWSYDDYDYVVSSVDTINNDILSNSYIITGEPQYMSEKRAAASWTTEIAYFAVVSGFEVTTICHTILPVLLLVIAYLAYYYMASLIIPALDNRLIFMILLEAAFVFGYHSHYSLTFRLLGVLWQGKAVLSAIAVPFIFAYLAEKYSKPLDNRNLFPIFAVSLGACSLTSMSMLLVSLVSVLVFIIMCIYNRRIYGVRYLLMSMIPPMLQLFFYTMISWLLADMRGYTPKHFIRGKDINWWYKWFG